MRRFKVSYREVIARDGAPLRVPFLRFAGRWLARLGFRIGERVCVDVRPGELVVRKEGDGGDEDLPHQRPP